jgi:hypothetical protein
MYFIENFEDFGETNPSPRSRTHCRWLTSCGTFTRKVAMRIAIQLGLCLITGSLSSHAQRFRQITIPTGPSPRWIAVADLNHDGNPDIAVANEGSDSSDSGTITILLGDGRGGFHLAPGSPFAAGHLPNDIAVADMNGDGNQDLVVANHQSPFLRVFLGDGRGGFHLAPGSPVDVHSNPHPHGVAVADFNSDGKPDVATDSWGNNQIEVLFGDGTGRLVTPGAFLQRASARTNGFVRRISTATATRISSPQISTIRRSQSCWATVTAAFEMPQVRPSLQAPNPGKPRSTTLMETATPIS